MKIIFHKITVEDKFLGKMDVAVPKYSQDKEVFYKLNGEFQVTVKQYRNLLLHNLLYEVADLCCENGILEHYKNKTMVMHELEEAIVPNVVDILLVQTKRPKEVLIHIAKYLFLPLEKHVNLDGSVSWDVCSISFESMDNIKFQAFVDQCFKLWADKLGITKQQLLSEVKQQ